MAFKVNNGATEKKSFHCNQKRKYNGKNTSVHACIADDVGAAEHFSSLSLLFLSTSLPFAFRFSYLSSKMEIKRKQIQT